MYRESAGSSAAIWMIGGFALGALTMYLLDPDRGNRRRALIRDKMYSAAVTTREAVDAQARDLANRAKGLGAEVSGMVRH